jgi:hypothetical protein
MTRQVRVCVAGREALSVAVMTTVTPRGTGRHR